MALAHGPRSWFSLMVLAHGSRSWFSLMGFSLMGFSLMGFSLMGFSLMGFSLTAAPSQTAAASHRILISCGCPDDVALVPRSVP